MALSSFTEAGTRWPGLFFRFGCLAAILISLALFIAKFRMDNSPFPVDLAGFSPAAPPEFDFALEQCELRKDKLWVTGWLLRTGEGSRLRSTKVVLVPPGRSHALALSTSMHVRGDLAAKAGLPDGRLPVAGFSASLSLVASGLHFKDWGIGVIYEHERERAIVHTACQVSWP